VKKCLLEMWPLTDTLFIPPVTFMIGSGAFVEGQLAGENRSGFRERNGV
jgi:hypothetical protein